jgi:hypothetical protein
MVGRDLVASGFATIVTRRMPLVVKKLLTHPRFFLGIPYAQYLVCCVVFVVFVDQHLFCYPFSFFY